MKETLKILICLILIGSSGCQKDNGSRHTVDSLISTKWILTGIRHTDTNIEELVPANLKFMNVVFNNSNKLHAISSCNVFDGDYLISGSNTIKIDNLCTTKMYCLNENTRLWESIYFDGFKSSDTFDFSGDTLTIIASSKIAMFFKAE